MFVQGLGREIGFRGSYFKTPRKCMCELLSFDVHHIRLSP